MQKQKLQTTAAYYAAFAAMGISMASLGPTLPGLAEHTRSSLSAISILFTARALGSLAGSVFGGQVYDRLRGHPIMAVMIVSIAALTALTPIAPVLWLLTAVLFITGAVQGVLNIGGNALLVWLHGREVGPFMNGLHFCFGVGTFLTPIIIAQFVARQGGLLWTYLLLAALILPTAVLVFLPSPPSPVKAQNQSSARFDPLLVVLISLVFGCYSGASTAYGGWILSYVTRMNLASEVTGDYLTSLFWGALTLGRLAAIPLAMRFKPQHLLRADCAGALLSLLAMLLWPRSLAAVIFTSAALGFALASIYPTSMSYSGEIMMLSGKITGLFAIGNSAGSMLIPWIIGQLFERAGPQSMTTVLVVDMLIALFVLLALANRTKREEVVEEKGVSQS